MRGYFAEISAQGEGNSLHVKGCGAEGATLITIMVVLPRQEKRHGGIGKIGMKGYTRK